MAKLVWICMYEIHVNETIYISGKKTANKLRNKMPNIKDKTVLNNIAVLQIWRAFYIFTFTHFKMTMIFTKS